MLQLFKYDTVEMLQVVGVSGVHLRVELLECFVPAAWVPSLQLQKPMVALLLPGLLVQILVLLDSLHVIAALKFICDDRWGLYLPRFDVGAFGEF